MAYVGPEKKAKILSALKPIMPKSWKWSLAVRHHSTIVLTIAAAPIDLLEIYTRTNCPDELRLAVIEGREKHLAINPYYWEDHFEGDLKTLFGKIMSALNLDNHDRSDPQTDYFDVGHYVEVRFGRWEKPFVVCGERNAA